MFFQHLQFVQQVPPVGQARREPISYWMYIISFVVRFDIDMAMMYARTGVCILPSSEFYESHRFPLKVVLVLVFGFFWPT